MNKISIPDTELCILDQKLLLARLPTKLANAEWIESDTNHVTITLLQAVIKTWTSSYSWRSQELILNSLPQFATQISVNGFSDLKIHFVHSRSTKPQSIPLLYLHGWPGSIMEIIKALPILNEKGFDVVAPSLPGWLLSSPPMEK